MSEDGFTERPANTFVKNDAGKVMMSLTPPEALLEVAKVFTFGAKTYPRDNFRLGTLWTRYSDALERHMNAWMRREDNDPLSGLNHLAHVAANAMILLVLQLGGLGEDDRPRNPEKKQ